MDKETRGPGIVICVLAVAAIGWFLFAKLHSGMSLPFGLHNPFAKQAPGLAWRDATPDETAEAKELIGKQMEAFKNVDYDTAVSYMGYDPRYGRWTKSGMAMMTYREFRGFIRNQEVKYGPVKATEDKKYLR